MGDDVESGGQTAGSLGVLGTVEGFEEGRKGSSEVDKKEVDEKVGEGIVGGFGLALFGKEETRGL